MNGTTSEKKVEQESIFFIFPFHKASHSLLYPPVTLTFLIIFICLLIAATSRYGFDGGFSFALTISIGLIIGNIIIYKFLNYHIHYKIYKDKIIRQDFSFKMLWGANQSRSIPIYFEYTQPGYLKYFELGIVRATIDNNNKIYLGIYPRLKYNILINKYKYFL